jgi:hypothetical protein
MNMKTTVSTNLPAVNKKVSHLLTQQKITPKDIEHLNKRERDHLARTINQTLGRLTDTERDTFLEKIEQMVPAGTNSDIWEYNHMVISNAISKLMHQDGSMPTKNDIAKETGLSRQTVAKHLVGFMSSPEFTEQMDQFKFMAPKVLANVYKVAGKGDMRAARFFFEMVGTINKQQGNTIVNEQKNYIQINNTILSQENLKQLTS